MALVALLVGSLGADATPRGSDARLAIGVVVHAATAEAVAHDASPTLAALAARIAAGRKPVGPSAGYDAPSPSSPGGAPAGAGPVTSDDLLAVARGDTLTSDLADDPVAEAAREKRLRRAMQRGNEPGSKQRDALPTPRDVATGPDPIRQAWMPTRPIPAPVVTTGLGLTFGLPLPGAAAGSGTAGAPGAADSGGSAPAIASGTVGATRYAPPDTDGDVGRDHYVQVVSASMLVLDKTTGAVLLGPVPTNALWAGFGGPCELEHADAIVRYDSLADRWILARPTIANRDGPYLYCVAVSQSGDPRGGWWRYAFASDLMPDFAKLAVWPDAYYATYNLFDASGLFRGARVCAFDRSAMLAGEPASQQCASPTGFHHSLLVADVDGTAPPPAGTPAPVLALGLASSSLTSWAFVRDPVDPARSGLTEAVQLPVPAFSLPCGTGGACVPQPGTTTLLDTMGDRLGYRLAYRDLGDHGLLTVAHAVATEPATATSDGTAIATGIRWYALRLEPGAITPALADVGTFAPDGRHRWLPSVASDRSGGIALGYTLSGETTKPSMAVAGRSAADPPGLLGHAESIVVEGQGSQTDIEGWGLSRWGDYASLTVDPIDGCTFYFTSEYLPSDGVFNWATGVAWFRLPSCEPADASPATSGAAPGADGVPPTPTPTPTPTPSPGGAVAGITCVSPCVDPAVAPALPAGTVTGVLPRRGGLGTVVTISGPNLRRATAVWFGGIRSTRIVRWSPTQVLAAVPSGARSGRIAVTIGTRTAFAPGTFTVTSTPMRPRLFRLDPWAARPGARVLLRGANLLGATVVRFGGVPTRRIVALGGGVIAVIVPLGARSGYVTVTTPGGRAVSPWRFRVIGGTAL